MPPVFARKKWEKITSKWTTSVWGVYRCDKQRSEFCPHLQPCHQCYPPFHFIVPHLLLSYIFPRLPLLYYCYQCCLNLYSSASIVTATYVWHFYVLYLFALYILPRIFLITFFDHYYVNYFCLSLEFIFVYVCSQFFVAGWERHIVLIFVIHMRF